MDELTRSLISDQVRAVFADEAVELLRNVELVLNELPVATGAVREALWLEMLRSLHTLKGSAGVTGEEELTQHIHELEERVRRLQQDNGPLDAPAMEELSRGLLPIHLAVDRLLAEVQGQGQAEEPEERVERPPVRAEAGALARTQAPVGRSSAGEFLRVRPEQIDALHTLAGELSVVRLQRESLSKQLLELRERFHETAGALRQVSSRWSQVRGQPQAARWQEMSAHLQAFSASLSGLAQEFEKAAGQLPTLEAQTAQVSASLEEGIRDLRLMPLQPFFEEYAKVVRETAREGRKDARLIIDAQGAEIDRAVLMQLRDPLLHLVRNAVVHGIEPPERRMELGKSAHGTVRLEGRCEGTRAVLKVIDDGGGIDVERVRQKALSMRLIDGSELLEEDLLIDLLTRPGFSTREIADGLAGRGMGLDVVVNYVRELDGHLRVSTEAGAGTVFTINVPVSASTGAGLVVLVEDHHFGILLSHIERVIRIGGRDIFPLEGREVVLIEDAPVAVVLLGSLIHVEASPLAASKRPAVVLRLGKQRLVVIVDDILGEQAFMVRPLSRAFADAHFLLGAAIQPDGMLLPLLHIAALFQRASGASPGRAARTFGTLPEVINEKIRLLVVDDSLTMRTLLRNILLAAHYDVSVAHDGQAALEVLERLPVCHLIITDLQMPRMDGAALCQAIRSSARPDIPILVITSIGDAAEKRKALEAGANAYIVKADFEQGHFLDLVARFSGAVGTAA